ncbi:MAG: hypothetical protein JRJ60_04460 [Deltaproteobacteria bacterium]|nr:hypothetical protein [Deltaproteobacteria bacterium]
MQKDIRDREWLTHEDILALNFIRRPVPFVFRRHYRAGLRSHILEVLRPEDLTKETEGVESDSLTWFPRARPLRMLRIFRTRFADLKAAKQELHTVKIVESYLSPDLMARSNEFLVDYETYGARDLLLCGLQEYVEGEILDPWGHMTHRHLTDLFKRMKPTAAHPGKNGPEMWLKTVKAYGGEFIERIKAMIREAGHVPDLAGVGNLLLTSEGRVRLVDINNISEVSHDTDIRLDDRGYPVCDKSIEALSLLEQKLLNRSFDPTEKIYRTFLDPRRMRDVKEIERKFHMTVESGYPAVAPD